MRFRTEHSTGHVTAHGHSNYRGYDAYAGKTRELGNDRPYACPCGRRFKTEAARTQHQIDYHTGEFEP